ncbi:hypothetical protein [Enterococcus xiangfangensis]|uniref:hypothetical protein n=1 Tax=Enterococcus xiangfangensis TaxID=1296537 RepID=UPI0010F7D548|nr:hypothetical protein [Enterococcus xiangfangensis]MBM7712550.1 hypothetical protein [Enterococcus xiangfangensis]
MDFNTLAQAEINYGKYLLSQDHLYKKIPENQRSELIQQAVECGESAAENLVADDLRNYCRQEKIEIEFFQEELKAENFRFVLAEFQLPKLIRINQSLLAAAEPFLLAQDFFKDQRAADILLAHELYHYLENQQQLFTIKKQLMYQTGPFKRQARLHALSEIAAMSFAQAYLELPFSPVILNIALLYPIAPEYSEQLAKQLLVID